MRIRKRVPIWLMLLLIVAAEPSTAIASNLVLLRSFSSMDGTVDFLPGAWISIWEDGKSTYYKYDGKQFVRADALPDLLKGWSSFFNSGDYADQISRQDFDSRIASLLPSKSKIKKVIETSIKAKSGGTLAFICYTVKSADPDVEPNTTDLYLAVLERTSIDNHSRPTYKLLETINAESESDYGELSIEDIGSFGSFLVLYSEQVAASSSSTTLDVYKIAPM